MEGPFEVYVDLGVLGYTQISCMFLSLSLNREDLVKNARVKSLVFRRTYRFQESDKDESKLAQL